jgi:tRNA A-37 threonylcarbamoyl transferase component Bud32
LVVDLAGKRVVVRHYHRGGAVADALGDRYFRFADNRVLHELRVSEAARARGVATPPVQCGAWYSAALFRRYDIATEYIPESQDLSTVLFGDVAPSDQALSLTAQLIRSMVRGGLLHRDLNVKNILLDRSSAWVLDLDRCTINERVTPQAAHAMRSRFFRSVNKWEARTGRRVHDVARNVLSEAFDA